MAFGCLNFKVAILGLGGLGFRVWVLGFGPLTFGACDVGLEGWEVERLGWFKDSGIKWFGGP